jgi:hypothetical protein
MTPIQFKNLHEGDLLRDANGRGYTVLHATGGDFVLVQNVVKIPIVHAERWKINARLSQCREVPVTRPGPFEMHQELIAAGFQFSEYLNLKNYRKDGVIYENAQVAWDELHKEKLDPREEDFRKCIVYPRTLTELHDQLEKGGWKRDPNVRVRPAWTGPNGQRAAGSKEAWEIMKGIL